MTIGSIFANYKDGYTTHYGLGSIVLFGQQIQIENRLEELVQEIGQAKTNLETQADICKKYADATDVASPQYWVSLIA